MQVVLHHSKSEPLKNQNAKKRSDFEWVLYLSLQISSPHCIWISIQWVVALGTCFICTCYRCTIIYHSWVDLTERFFRLNFLPELKFKTEPHLVNNNCYFYYKTSQLFCLTLYLNSMNAYPLEFPVFLLRPKRRLVMLPNCRKTRLVQDLFQGLCKKLVMKWSLYSQGLKIELGKLNAIRNILKVGNQMFCFRTFDRSKSERKKWWLAQTDFINTLHVLDVWYSKLVADRNLNTGPVHKKTRGLPFAR